MLRNTEYLKPKLRFKTFTTARNSFKFSDVFEFKKTFSCSRDQLADTTNELGNIHYVYIHTKYPSILDITKFNIPKIKYSDTHNVAPEDLCKDWDLVIADASEEQEKLSNFFNFIDEILNIKNAQIIEMTLWQDGLMQEVFV